MKILMTLLMAVLCLPVQAREISEFELIKSPSQDARELYQKGIREFVGIDFKDQILTPGLKGQQRTIAENQYKIRPLNKRWKTFANIEHDKERMHDLRIYANRFNITMWRLIEAENNKPKRIYRY